MKRKIKFTTVLLCALIGRSIAQDFHLSMYDAAPIFLNPAMTGLIETKMRAHAHYRTQWSAIAFKPFTTALVSFDMPTKTKWSYGGQISNMRAGLSNYNVLEIIGSGSYLLPLDKEKYHQLSLGMHLGVKQKKVEYQALTYDAQWSNASGGSFDKNLSNNETFARGTQFQEVVNFGALYYYSKQQSRINPFLGISGFNLTKPRETFFGGNNRLPMRFYMHTGVRVNVNELFYFIPKVLVMRQTNNIEQTYAIDAGYFVKGEKFYLLAGYVYRAADANIAYVGLKKDNYIIKLGYDMNTSSLRSTSKARGAFEISLTYLGKKSKVQEIKNCPRL
ncbi:MAG: PorP/SprF family type IX secretion system membrane protein [Bacteroidia bacterium]|jgi:type IX secretion system PorP/SprF family membrane protein|nr:PorP/SprF family type IX secretion system membrane protein [Bacteroidia bacterium]